LKVVPAPVSPSPLGAAEAGRPGAVPRAIEFPLTGGGIVAASRAQAAPIRNA
jgi:hypothetical protein